MGTREEKRRRWWDIHQVRGKEDRRQQSVGESEWLIRCCPPWHHSGEKTSNKAHLTTLFNKAYASFTFLSLPFFHFTSSSSAPLGHGFSSSIVSPHPHLTNLIFQQHIKSGGLSCSQIIHQQEKYLSRGHEAQNTVIIILKISPTLIKLC